MVCNCRVIVHSGKERKIQLFKEVIMPLPCFADLLIQGHRAIAIGELKRLVNRALSIFSIICSVANWTWWTCALANHEPLCQLN